MSTINRATFTSPEDLVNFDVWVSGSNNNNKVWELNLEELYIDFIVGVSTGTVAIAAQFAAVSCLKIATDTWVAMGNHGGVS